MADDIAPRISRHQTYRNMPHWRSARFRLQDDRGNHETTHELLDKLMSQIPGKDNYPGYIEDDSFGEVANDIRFTNHTPLNAAYYHRYYKTGAPGAMGLQKRHRGFSDDNLFVALNSRPHVVGSWMTDCEDEHCHDYFSRVSYAIPLEIIYLTPLAKWNPYNIEHKGKAGTELAETVTADKRDGGSKPKEAYNGTNSKVFYRTPAEFFSGPVKLSTPADTAKGAVGVLDKQGKVRRVRSSGIIQV